LNLGRDPGIWYPVRIDLRHTVRCPLAALYPFLADPANRPRWQASLRSVVLVDAGPPRVGQRWREKPRAVGSFAMRITELEPGRVWAEAFEGRAARGTIRLQFAPVQDGTELHVQAEIELQGARALLAPFVAPVLRRELRRDLDRAAALARG
jgi:hypothetical protein